MRKFIFTITAAILCGGALAHAQSDPGNQFSASAGEAALKAQELSASGQHRDAITVINKALDQSALSAFERASLLRMQAASYFEIGDQGQAIRAFEACLKLNGLPPAEQEQTRIVLAQLLITNERPRDGAQILEDWHRAGGRLSSVHFQLLTQAWTDQDNYQKALPWAKRWFDSVPVKERKHYELLNFIYAQLQDRTRQANIIRQMITRWPEDKTLWQSWASVLNASGDERGAFEVNVVMYQKGLLTDEAELLRLVQYYGFYDIPYWGARLLEMEMAAGRVTENQDNLVKLSNLWRQAREYDRAIPVLEKAVLGSQGGKLYAALGEALINRSDCEDAEAAFQTAMDRGYDRGKAWALIANCRYERSQMAARPDCDQTTLETRLQSPKYLAQDTALEAFEMVPSQSSQRRDAEKWMSFIRAEREAIENRCKFIETLEVEQCYGEIDRAYIEYPLTGKFEISETCLVHKDAYDAEFRVGKEVFN